MYCHTNDLGSFWWSLIVLENRDIPYFERSRDVGGRRRIGRIIKHLVNHCTLLEDCCEEKAL